jgi:hypothetical protein
MLRTMIASCSRSADEPTVGVMSLELSNGRPDTAGR